MDASAELPSHSGSVFTDVQQFAHTVTEEASRAKSDRDALKFAVSVLYNGK